MLGSLLAERNLGAIHSKDTRAPAWGATAGGNDMPGKETHFHQAAGHVFGQIQVFEDSLLAFPHLSEVARGRGSAVVHLIETQLQHDFSMPPGELEVKPITRAGNASR